MKLELTKEELIQKAVKFGIQVEENAISPGTYTIHNSTKVKLSMNELFPELDELKKPDYYQEINIPLNISKKTKLQPMVFAESELEFEINMNTNGAA
ncbi:hypothetical protein BTR22_18995 [Alkalihalophilus pseudofirmus]|uniref:hypothetical protein n=1 Tax=Alkalihalophilus pseudofirmus TaxID=79885 RepID=UPI000952C66C|nr:hypothetical protein BTR22_18995 [Alkalihalophilus pseudofirmus]